MRFQRIILILLIFIPELVLGQQNDSLSLSVQVKFGNSEQVGYSPIFIIDLENVGIHSVKVPKKSILKPGGHKILSFLNTVVEELESGELSLNDSSNMSPFRCNICFFGTIEKDFIINSAIIEPAQHRIIEESMLCYQFERGKHYRVRFSLDTEKTGLRGKSEWVYFQIP